MSIISAEKAVEILKGGGVVALPTETVYGLAGSIQSEQALARIFEIKARPLFDPLIVHVLDIGSAKKVCAGFGELHEALAEKFWPGPLTLIGERSRDVSDLITAGQDTVAVRSPAHPKFREVLKALGCPLAAPSANRFKKTSPTKAEHVVQEFSGQVPVVDGGECEVGLESTIVKPRRTELGEIELTLYRPGVLAVSEIQAFLNARFHKTVLVKRAGSTTGEFVPGQLKEHYQPSLPLILVLKKTGDVQHEAIQFGFKKPVVLNLPSEIYLAARKLYGLLRESSLTPGADSLVLSRPEWWDDELAEALRDRLSKASTHILLS